MKRITQASELTYALKQAHAKPLLDASWRPRTPYVVPDDIAILRMPRGRRKKVTMPKLKFMEGKE